VITDALIGTFLTLLDALVSLFPSWTPPVLSASTGAVAAVQQASAIFPVASMVQALVACLLLLVLLQGWDLVVWVFHQFWGSD
jgi:hypothetical protein